MPKSTSELKNDIIALVLTGGSRTTAANVRTLLDEFADALANKNDGGNVFENPVGYVNGVTISNDNSFITKQYFETALSNIVFSGIVIRSTGPAAHRIMMTIDDTLSLNFQDLGV